MADFYSCLVCSTEHFFDLTGSLTYIVLVLAACYLSEAFDIRSMVIVGLVLIWALRLDHFSFSAFKRRGGPSFSQHQSIVSNILHDLDASGAWVFVTVSAGLGAITSSNKVAPELAFITGIAMWIAGFVIEVIADRQKTAFRADPANAEAFITSGLWAWSRHPNYFGEILLWAGIAVIAVPTLQGNQIFLLLSLIWVVVLLTAISGVRCLKAAAKNAGAMTQSILIT